MTIEASSKEKPSPAWTRCVGRGPFQLSDLNSGGAAGEALARIAAASARGRGRQGSRRRRLVGRRRGLRVDLVTDNVGQERSVAGRLVAGLGRMMPWSAAICAGQGSGPRSGASSFKTVVTEDLGQGSFDSPPSGQAGDRSLASG